MFRQSIVGLTCFFFNLLLMWYLVGIAHFHILWASTICFFVLNAIGHHLSRKFVFADSSNRYTQSFFRFVLVMVISLMLNLGAMSLATSWLGLPYLLASAAIAAIFFFANFTMHNRWTFR